MDHIFVSNAHVGLVDRREPCASNRFARQIVLSNLSIFHHRFYRKPPGRKDPTIPRHTIARRGKQPTCRAVVAQPSWRRKPKIYYCILPPSRRQEVERQGRSMLTTPP